MTDTKLNTKVVADPPTDAVGPSYIGEHNKPCPFVCGKVFGCAGKVRAVLTTYQLKKAHKSEDGKWHHHDVDNRAYYKFGCSRGHYWIVMPHYNCWCGWNSLTLV
jgi:hypothetical protein